MVAGKISSAMGLLAELHAADVLLLSDIIDSKSVKDMLKAKHPNPSKSNPNYISSPSNRTIPCLLSSFELIGCHIRTAAMKTHGSQGTSVLNLKTLRIQRETLEMQPYFQRSFPLQYRTKLFWDINQFHSWIQSSGLNYRERRVLWTLHWRKNRRIQQSLHEIVSASLNIATNCILLSDM